MTSQLPSSYQEIIRRIDAVRRKEQRLALIYGILASLLVALLVALSVVVMEELLRFGTVGRTVLFVAASVGTIGSATWFAVRPLLRLMGILSSPDDRSLALRVGAHYPQIRDRLLDALELFRRREELKGRYSIDLIDASFSDLVESIRPLRFEEVINTSPVRKIGRRVSLASAIVVLTVVVSPSGFFSSVDRLFHFHDSYAAELPVTFELEPGNADAVRGQSVQIVVHSSGRPLKELSLLTRESGQIEFERTLLRAGSDGRFRSTIQNIKTSTDYYAEGGDARSGTYRITVIDRPVVRVLRVTVASPAYTRIPTKALDENTGDFSAYPGSRATIDISASKDLSSATLRFADSTETNMNTDGAAARATFAVKKGGRYRILLKDNNGLGNIDPLEYSITILTDAPPSVEVLVPGRNIDLTDDAALQLKYRLKDDFGFSNVRLAYRLSQSKFEKPADEFSFLQLPVPKGQDLVVDASYLWNLSSLHLVPEDAVAYYIEVFDNDNVNGPKSARSDIYTLRLPSLEEVLSDASQSQTSSMESMQSLTQEAEQFRKDVEDLQRETKKNRDKPNWQQQQKAEQLLRHYETMKQHLQESAKKLDDAVGKMEDHKVLSEQTMQKYDELQKLLEQLQSPELQEALKKLQESMKQLTPEQLRQSMDQIKASEDQYRKNLERIVELLKRIHIEQKLDELIKRAEDLAKQQEQLGKQSEQSDQPNEQSAKEQEDLQKQSDQLKNDMKQLEQKMEEFPKEMPVEEMSQAAEKMEQKNIGKKMQQAAGKMRGGRPKDAKQNQDAAQKDLTETQKDLMDVQKTLQQNQIEQIANELRKQLSNVLELSKSEESLKNETKGLDPNSQRFRNSADAQDAVKSDLSHIADALGELGKRTFAVSPEMGKEIGSAMNQMDQALQNMEGRNPGASSQKQGEAMGSLNRAAMSMQSALNGLQQGGPGGMGMAGLMGRLGQMAGQQGEINGQTQDAMGQGQGQGMSAQQQADYQRLAGQQAAVQKSLEDLSREAKNTGEFSKLLGDLDRIAQEMKEVQTDLVQGNVNPETINKQDRILSRLLDASKSTRERDYEKRRTAQSGKQVDRSSPADIDVAAQEGKNKLREELLKVLGGKYSRDYEELIRKYFEQLEQHPVEH